MIFVYKKWDDFCKKLCNQDVSSITCSEYLVDNSEGRKFVLKHDVETKPERALCMAQIENKYGHRGSYYVQAYLLKDEKNIEILKKIQKLGHEVSYHHDVMDSNKGDIGKAVLEFENNIKLFNEHGFETVTVCQHGNPVIERVGYTSNRDFFRSSKVRELYPNVFDIMVNFPENVACKYDYYSDAGRKFKLIYDPVNNDIVNSDDKNISYKNLDELFENLLNSGNNFIISTHPHRWMSSAVKYILKDFLFKLVKSVAKIMMKIPLFKRIMSKYYYLAKKI